MIDNYYILHINEKEKEIFKSNYEKAGLNFKYQFFEGINGNYFKNYIRYFIKKKKSELKENNIFKKINQITNGKLYIRNEKQLGHIRSFQKIIKNAIKNNYDKICILESDVYFSIDFNERMKEYEKFKDKKLFYLGSNDRNIRRTTSMFKFDEEKTLQSIKEKNEDLTEEEWNEILIHKRKNFYSKKKECYNDLIKKNDELLLNNIYQSDCPYGTFAMIIDKSIFNMILDVLSIEIFPTDVLFFYIQHQIEDDWCIAFPNIVIVDVTNSLILKARHQEKFAKSRFWKLKNYHI